MNAEKEGKPCGREPAAFRDTGRESCLGEKTRRTRECARLKKELNRVLQRSAAADLTISSALWRKGATCISGEAVLALREKHSDVVLEAAVPFPGQADGWSAGQRDRYRRLLQNCDIETVVQNSYTPDCMYRRNRYMVERSALLIAVYDGSRAVPVIPSAGPSKRAGADPDQPLRTCPGEPAAGNGSEKTPSSEAANSVEA
jgi:uncharacterized phage-like protein YoqJ